MDVNELSQCVLSRLGVAFGGCKKLILSAQSEPNYTSSPVRKLLIPNFLLLKSNPRFAKLLSRFSMLAGDFPAIFQRRELLLPFLDGLTGVPVRSIQETV